MFCSLLSMRSRRVQIRSSRQLQGRVDGVQIVRVHGFICEKLVRE